MSSQSTKNIKRTTPGRQSTHQTSPSPSPVPAPPVALTPGPRASRLQQVFSEALLRTLRANSYTNFAACFPTPAKHASASLASVWRQLNAKVEASARAEFEDILRERDVVRGLNELDRLIGEARLRKQRGEPEDLMPPHLMGADHMYQAHLAPHLIQSQELLNAKIQYTERENMELSGQVELQRQEIEQLLAQVQSAVADVENAVKAATEYDPDGTLRKEAEKMDQEVDLSR